jgi:hypothetical protein
MSIIKLLSLSFCFNLFGLGFLLFNYRETSYGATTRFYVDNFCQSL